MAMEQHSPKQQIVLPMTNPITGSSEEPLVADVDEPPEHPLHWIRPQLPTTFGKANAAISQRRESLLTRQLHSEAEQSTDDEASHAPPRALSTQSTWSNPSVASTAELTSDDGHSVASPAISPPLPATAIRTVLPVTEKPLSRDVRIGGHEKTTQPSTEPSVEAGLGRKRCISFACGNAAKTSPTSQPVALPKAKEDQLAPSSPPKRKCTIKFACPMKAGVDAKPADVSTACTSTRRQMSPPPERRSSARAEAMKTHRGSDSTVTHGSPKSVRKVPAVLNAATTPTTPIADPYSRRRLSNVSNSSTEATRFHEFASSDDEPEEWVQESGCHRSRLTVNDTLKKENILRKACEEVEAEAVDEDDDEDDLDDQNADDDEDDEENEDEEVDQDDEEESDDGFRTDDEEGFAESESEGEESDEDWWRPGGRSTAATSVEHMDRLMLSHKDEDEAASSLGSASSGHASLKGLRIKSRRRRLSRSMPIGARSQAVDLPDSTDFVCGTLDEDRPLEQAYLNQLKQKEAAKHKARPQDIDPTFPTSDPEMDEEDDEDLVDPDESEKENLVHGELDELDEEPRTLRPITRPRARSNANKSPAPATRRRSPAPTLLKRQPSNRSPPPARRSTARSPPPRKLFGHSPQPSRSPAPGKVMPSPPNTRRVSPWTSNQLDVGGVLAGRPQLTHTASLPRNGFQHQINQLRVDESLVDCIHANGEIPKRGAIDIYKGLEKKRQRRKEKLYQKLCAKAAAKGEKAYKVKPGRGAERMREVGLEMQRYHGKGGHILSM